MLGRSQRSNVMNQENPTAGVRGGMGGGASLNHHFPHKTPAAGSSKILGGGNGLQQTGGKGVLQQTGTTTARTTRVLGAKDGNSRMATNGASSNTGKRGRMLEDVGIMPGWHDNA